jgi:hypothetical protein
LLNFKEVTEDFSITMDALREFVSSVGPVLREREEKLAAGARKAISRFATARIVTGEDIDWSEIPEESREPLSQVRQGLKELAALHSSERVVKAPEGLRKYMAVKFVDGKPELDWEDPGAIDILPAHRAFNAIKTELRLLFESVLMTLTSRSEWLIAQLLHLFFHRFPTAAGMSDPFFSLDDLESMQSISDARGVLIEHKVESIMRMPLADWLKFFRDKPKLGMSYLDDQSERIEEVFLRRNLVVHNGGRVSRHYIQQVNEELRPGVCAGELAELSVGYIDSSIDLLERNFTLVAVELWKKLAPTDVDRATFLLSRSVQKLNEKSWELARSFSQFCMNDSGIPEFSRLAARVNYWQSFKWSGKYEAICDEVEKADFSAKSPIFRLAQATIKDDFDQVFAMLPGIIASGDLKKADLISWPLFQSVRGRPEFAGYSYRPEELTNVDDTETRKEKGPPDTSEPSPVN